MSTESPGGPPGAGDEAEGTPPTLQTRLEAAAEPAYETSGAGDLPSLRDPVALLAHLDVSGRFHRDGPVGRLYHLGQVSLRENVPTRALHIAVDDNRLAAHVDGVSPLRPSDRGAAGYSATRALAHNLVGMSEDAMWLVRGRQGDHDCALDCEWIAGEPDEHAEEAGLLDPRESVWSVQLEARFRSTIDEARLRRAMAIALGRRDLTRDPLEVVVCADDDALQVARSRLHTMAIAVNDRPPLHAYLARHPSGDVLMLTLNHAACDGFGALSVLRAIGAAYAGERYRALDFLATDDLPVRPSAIKVPPLPKRLRKRAVERVRDALTRPAELAADEPDEDAGVGFHTFALSAAETHGLSVADRDAGVTCAVVAALHLAVADWNAEHDQPGRQIGVLIASDLRPEDWPEETIGNFSLNARVSTGRRNRVTPAAALREMTAQIKRTERLRTGTALIVALRRNGLLGLWAKQSLVVLRPLTTNHTVDAAMLCDLGVVDAQSWFGEDAGEIAQLWFSVPSRSPLSVSIGAVTVAGRLNLTLRYPRCLFSPDAARRFAECYAQHLRTLAAQA